MNDFSFYVLSKFFVGIMYYFDNQEKVLSYVFTYFGFNPFL